MARPPSTYRPGRGRSNVLRFVLLTGLGVVFVRLFYLQVLRRDYFLSVVAPMIAVGSGKLQAPHPGALLFRNGEPLAESVLLYHVVADPVRMLKNGESFQAVARQLAPIIERPAAEILQDLRNNERRGYVELKHWVKQSTVKQVDDLRVEGLSVRQVWRRQYPLGKTACHVAGGRDRFHRPLSGLEFQYRQILDGQPGAEGETMATPVLADLTGTSEDIAPVDGRDVILTLDPILQRQVETEMDRLVAVEEPKWASCIVMDPRNGEILALSSRPAYDPNAYVVGKPAPGCRWSSVPTSATRNWPVEAEIEQGSTFKIILAAAALSSGRVSPAQRYRCSGYLALGGKPISCWGKYAVQGHGSLDMTGMLANSCNICAAQTALAIGREQYRRFMAKCGIGEDPQAGFPAEALGKLARPESIRPRDLATMAFGQNVSCSSLQLTSIVAGLVNDGVMMRPHIVGAVINRDGSLYRAVQPAVDRTLCSPEVSRQLRDMLEQAVVNGTGRAAAIPGVRVGGKTGTAQQWDPNTHRHDSEGHVVSFVMVFPLEKPRYVIHVACRGPKRGAHGADVAAPVCQRLGKFILQQMPDVEASGGAATTTAPRPGTARSGQGSLARAS